MSEPDESTVLADTQAWFERCIIGLNLCPFAHAPHRAGRIRWTVSAANDVERLLVDLCTELTRLDGVDPDETETTVIIHPHVLNDFDEYNQFLDAVDRTVAAQGLEGVIQVASFHPDYRFADAPPGDQANASNRSPFPMLHLLREASIAAAIDGGADTEAIVARNLTTLRNLSAQAFAALTAHR